MATKRGISKRSAWILFQLGVPSTLILALIYVSGSLGMPDRKTDLVLASVLMSSSAAALRLMHCELAA